MEQLKLLIASLLLITPLAANAHTITVGTTNAGPGSVTLWLGSYHGNALEGSMTLNGATMAFDTLLNSMPIGLVDGTNNFYSSGPGMYTNATDCVPTSCASLPVNGWQGVTFSGLAAGTYAYTISGMASALWSDWGGAGSNWTGSIVITAADVGQVPEPGTLALLGLGLAGMGLARRKKG